MRKKWVWGDHIWKVVGGMAMFMLLYIAFYNGRLEKATRASLYYTPQNLFVELTLVEGAIQKGAVCLDGSPPAYHLQEGSGAGKNNWLIHVEGGGWCSSKKSCAFRAATRLGSSIYMEKNISFHGILSNSPLENPDFYNWNRVKVRYCDGGSLSGEVEAPVEINEESHQIDKLYFRGQRIWNAVMEDLLSKGMNKAKKALLSGCSAGGLAAIIHCDDFRSRLSITSGNVKCLSDAGFFLDVKNFIGNYSMRSFYKKVVIQHGIAKNLPKSCITKRDASQCFFPQYLVKDINTPLFILQPGYDIWQIEHVLVPVEANPLNKWTLCKSDPSNCNINQLKMLQEFRDELLEKLGAIEESNEGGFYIDSCFIHCQTESELTWHKNRTPVVHGMTIAEAVGKWFFKRTVKETDCPYPCNPTCL